MADYITLYSIGVIFTVTLRDADTKRPKDISLATVKELVFTTPGGESKTRTASFTTDGTNGKIQYTSIAGDLDATGEWGLKGYIDSPSFTGFSDEKKFAVTGSR
jgi:hypothetical protein